MTTIRIILKDLRQGTRDWQSNSLMILFPIVLMALLGTALSGAFSGSTEVDARVLYTVESSSPLSVAFEEFKTQGARLGVEFTRVSGIEEGRAAVREAPTSCFLEVSGEAIRLTRSSRSSSEVELVEYMLSTFVRRYNAVRAIITVDPRAVAGIAAAPSSPAVRTSSLDGIRTARAVDYYSVTMLTFIIMYASLFGMFGVRKERTLRTLNRILSAPVRRGQLLAGKVVGGIAMTIVQVAAVMLFSRFVLGGYWGNDLGTVALVLLAEATMTVGIGVGVAYLIRSEGAATGIINSLIPVLAWFAGSYVPLDIVDPSLSRIAVANPLSWVNRAILGVIYGSDYSAVAPAILICLAVAAAFLVPAALISRRETV